MNPDNSKRLAKNTLMLYFRMLFSMVVAFYTSRVVLQQLGVNDFGIYNVVGGFVAMFGIVSNSMTSSVSRFLTFEIGKGNNKALQTVFSTSVYIQLLLALLVIILIEIIGVWFLKNRMTILPQRIEAAYWVLQCSALTFVVNMISVPYNAAIIAHERMQAFAYISILEVSLKLLVAFLLGISLFDSLKLYAVLLALTSLIIRYVYSLYCRKHFEESKLIWKFDKKLVKEIASFSGWNFIGSTSAILRDQGVNLLLNIFYGTVVNAARGIANQVNNAIYSFSSNFMMAVNPQIIKSYAAGEREQMFSLMRTSTRLSYFLLFILSSPILFEAEPLLHLWLNIVPDYANQFTILILIFSLSESLGIPLQFVNQATGKIRNYQLVVGITQLLNFPVAYFLLYKGLSPISVYVSAIVISQICLFLRLIMLRISVELNIVKFIKEVYIKILIVSGLSLIIPGMTKYLLSENQMTNWFWIIVIMILSVLSAIGCVWTFGCKESERVLIISKITSILKINRDANSQNR